MNVLRDMLVYVLELFIGNVRLYQGISDINPAYREMAIRIYRTAKERNREIVRLIFPNISQHLVLLLESQARLEVDGIGVDRDAFLDMIVDKFQGELQIEEGDEDGDQGRNSMREEVKEIYDCGVDQISLWDDV